jgi:pimeloyl-ACP methyl ester carboxylesterase
VRARTGAEAIDYVGFSMGGILLYAALGVAGSIPWSHVRRVVILGSPGKLLAPFPGLSWIARVPRWLVPALPLRVPSRMVAFMAEWITTPIHHLIYNPRNVERGSAGPALMTIQDVPRTLMGDFAGFLARGGEVTFEGTPILPGLSRVTIPVRFFAGAADRLAPPEAVRAAFDAWGRDATVDKQLTILSKETHTADYGHGDLAIGRGATRDLYAPAETFLDAP